MAPALTIGEFSRITHLSIKTLRYYHRVGLLEPVEVNADTGYRYYSLGQAETAQAIRRFRDLDMPVEDVRAVLAAPDPTARDALITRHLDRMQAQLEQTQAAVASLRSLLTRAPDRPRIERRSVPATLAIAISAVVHGAEVIEWWAAAMAELRATGLHPTGAAGGLFEQSIFTDELGSATLFIPVAVAPAQPIGRVTAFTVPAAELAVALHLGNHDDADRTYAAVGSYVAEHGIGVDGPVREYYLVDSADPADWRTEICWPIRPSAHPAG